MIIRHTHIRTELITLNKQTVLKMFNMVFLFGHLKRKDQRI